MTTADRYQEASVLTSNMPLPKETAIPSRKKRSHSLIPPELLNHAEGGMERAALATVFGVREYTEPKVLWEKQLTTPRPDHAIDNTATDGFIAITSHATVANPLASPSTSHDGAAPLAIETYLDSMLSQVGKQQFSTTMPNGNTKFDLPSIPIVSQLDDWWKNPSTTSAFPGRNASSSASHPRSRQDSLETAPPLIFHEYPPAIFDLLKSDSDDRIIIWHYEMPATAVSASTGHPQQHQAVANAAFSTPNIQRTGSPFSLGFSSNTTAVSTSTYAASHSSDKPSMKSLPRFLSKIKHRHHQQQDASSEQQLSPLRARFSRRRRSAPPPANTLSPPAPVLSLKVIEAATVEKLVEKLTITLDYTFMTDFFLTYRIFLSPIQLCKLLILRFRWGLENNDDERCIVRIRTFVVLRHWLLNYFVHDFTPSRYLREILTEFLNALPHDDVIRHSPRDQRIVKGLKRVVRRLKKVHYPRTSQHVQVISPPPPTFEEERLQLKVRAKLSQSPLRRKTEEWMQKGMAVEDRHHGNLAIQDARVAPIRLIGSPLNRSITTDDTQPASLYQVSATPSLPPLPPLPPPPHPTAPLHPSPASVPPSPPMTTASLPVSAPPTPEITSRHRNMSQNSILARYASNLSIGRRAHQQQERAKVKESYLRRMEQQRRTMEDTEHHPRPDHDLGSLGSDDSLESLISAGTTDQEDDDDDDSSSYATGESDEDDDEDVDLAELDPRVGTKLMPLTSDTVADISKRRSVYNANLRSLTPLVSPSPSMIQGMASSVSAPTGLHTSSASAHDIDNHLLDRPHRVSKIETQNEKHGLDDIHEKTLDLVESPTSLTSPASLDDRPKTRVGPPPTTSSLPPPQRKLSQRLASVFRTAKGTKRASLGETTLASSHSRATVIQPPLMTPTPSQDQARTRPHVYSEKVQVPLDEKEQTSSTPPPGQRVMSNMDDLRTSLDEILPPASMVPNPASADVYRHLFQSHHGSQDSSSLPSPSATGSTKLVELDLPAWNPNEPHPSLQTLYHQPIILRHSSESLAQQLCLVEQFILRQVNWEELVHCRWTKMSRDSLMNDQDLYPGHPNYNRFTTDSLSLHDDVMDAHTFYSRQTRQLQLLRGEQEGGVQHVIKRFNTVCQWVSSEIVRTRHLDQRVQVVEKFIRLAQKCQLYSNFATLVQILLGLQSPSVSRLRKTWARVGDSEMRLLDELSEFTSPIKNWKHIRDNMTVVADEYGMSPTEVQVELPGAADRHLNKPKIKLPFGGCIPFLGLYLSDLVFNSEQPSYLEPSHDHHKIYQAYTKTSTISPLLCQPLVNFRKYRIIATIIKRVLTFQTLSERYSFDHIKPLYDACFHLEALDADMIRQLSLDIEAPPIV
ncbi:ras GEF [Hesseltinella vesiculosa]|uniref:Ras GEF n=1 Tax=Hesseltinella vesiculosa TaxID=101127 RepID=A0A1X2GWR8_9FUNG|nr:ras GEF [Hesseltinella vesiculosa]